MSVHARHPARPRPDLSAFLSLGFRPLYPAACAWAAVSVMLWVFAPQGIAGVLGGVYWHMHEMLWGFIATIAVGFLLTASATWTGHNPLRGPALGLLTLLWLASRLGLLLPGWPAFAIAAACQLLFFVAAAAAMARVIFKARNSRNYGVPLLVLGLGLADGLFLWTIQGGDHASLMQRFELGLLCMAVIALLIARRVIPFFAMRAITGLSLPMHSRSGRWQLAAALLAIALLVLDWPAGAALALAAAGAIALWQLWAWKPGAVRRVPLLWVLYLGYGALGAGLLVAAAHSSGLVARAAWPAHVIGMAGFSVLIIGMVTRTALGHLGRPLRTDRSMVTAYGLVIAAALLRLLALWPTAFAPMALYAATVAWTLGFAVYLWRFLPLLIRPRVDVAS